MTFNDLARESEENGRGARVALAELLILTAIAVVAVAMLLWWSNV